ncbi:MAG: ABC transporter permease [Cyclobacteriaceae bacterium]|nr:ABC transporter permease [Cyclobacteriaceae bacterium]
MVRNFLLITLRNFRRYKGFTAINLSGLALGLSCSIFILLWVVDELSFDGFHENGDRLYRILKRDFFAQGRVEVYPQGPGILVDALKAEIPEIEMGSQISWEHHDLITVGTESNKESGRYVQPDFLRMFSYPFLRGDASIALETPTSIVISERLADKYFPNEDPVGKSLRVNRKEEYQITGVFKDIPRHSSVRFDYLLHWDVFLAHNEWAKEWENNAPRAYVMLLDPKQREAVDGKIKDFVHKRVSDPKTDISELFLQPYEEAYLYSRFTNGQQDGGRIDYVRTFSLVAVVVLLIACINFMNLATAQSMRRSKEIGIRKATGASRKWLVTQFLGEAFVFSVIGLALALLLVELAMPTFRLITEKDLEIPYGDYFFLSALGGIALITALLSGIYPALFLSSFNIVKVLKGTLKFGSNSMLLRKGMVVFQFSLTIVLIFCTVVVYRQMQYIQSKNLGFDRENLIVVNFENNQEVNLTGILNESLHVPGVKSATISTTPPLASGNSTTSVDWPGKPDDLQMAITQMAVGYDYLSTMGIRLKEGRDFSRDFPSDSTAYVVNEEAVKKMNLENPLGQVITFWSRPGPIIGIMEDYHISSFHDPIEPIILHLHPQWSNLMIARAEAGKTTEALEGIRNVVNKINPQFPFDYRFVDDTFNDLYRSETTVGTLANYFAGLAIFISCLGLLGLIIFSAEQRTKEIGVRKVLGASVSSIYGLLSRDFIVLVVLAFVLSAPVAWWLMNEWLSGFAYRTTITLTVFVMAGVVALGIALLTISYQALRAALENPVKSLRSE